MSVEFLAELFQSIAERGRSLLGWSSPLPPANADPRSLFEALLARQGEASGLALAEAILTRWTTLDTAQRQDFLDTLCRDFGADAEELALAIKAYQQHQTDLTAQAVHRAAEPRRHEIIRRLNMAPGGTGAIVEMRAIMLDGLKQHPELRALDADFLHLLSSWFNRGFLVLRRIDWATSANILEKIIRYEAVHQINGWDDLRRRIEPSDRRCFAFFHPQLVDEPLIFVEVALTREIPDAIGPLLAPDRPPIAPQTTTTAVFYSISNTQRGLAGVSFGDFLIKHVVEELRRDLEQLSTFVTLSPMPGFGDWVRKERVKPDGALDAETRDALVSLDDGWMPSGAVDDPLEKPLRKAGAQYLLQAKTSAGLPIDPVARFHLRNGARVERINFGADTSKRGLAQSHGLMVNYLYDLKQIELNHEAFTAAGEIAVSGSVEKLLSSTAPTLRNHRL